MIFTEQELKRLEELVSWGINKGIQDQDLKTTRNKLQKMLRYEADLRMYTEDPEYPVQADNKYVLEHTVTMVEQLLQRAITPAEGTVIRKFIDRGCAYEQIRFGIEQSISDLQVLDWTYVEKILNRELG